MEFLDLYDDTGKKLNEIIIRGEKTVNGRNIMLSVIYIKNEEDKFLIQKTSAEKGGKYSTTGGHVKCGENGLKTIEREIEEKLGIKILVEEIKHVITFKYPNKNCIFNVYYVEIKDIPFFNIQKKEVDELYFLTVEEIKKLINDKKFLETHGYIFYKYIINNSTFKNIF